MADAHLWKYDPDYHRLAEFLGVDRFDREDFEIAKKIALIADWAGFNKGKDVIAAQESVTKLRHKLGVQFVGKPLVTELYKIIRLDQTRQKQSDVSLGEVINHVVAEKRRLQEEQAEAGFRSEQTAIARKASREQQTAERQLQKDVDAYRKSFKPEPTMKIKEIPVLESIPVPV